MFHVKHRKMVTMTREESVKLFREMWYDMYVEITTLDRCIYIPCFKEMWLERMGIVCLNNCPLCEYAFQQAVINKNHMCNNCPIDWKSESSVYMCERGSDVGRLNGLWVQACDCEVPDLQAQIVHKILDLKEV